jgi:GT2 family glycosyltransferase
VILTSPTYNRFDECVSMIKSAYAGTIKPEHTIIYDNSCGKFIQHLQNDVTIPSIEIVVPQKNHGCAIAWNNMIKRAHEINPSAHVIVSNDDITFYDTTLQAFEEAIHEHPEELVYAAGGMKAPNAFSLFATRYDKMQDSIGMFDEMFLYPYCEDGDYARRMMLSGRKIFRVVNADADHIGSATIAAYTHDETLMHHVRFSRNAMYFEMKWGVDHNNIYSTEGYTKPFDNDPQIEEIVKSTIQQLYGE